MERPNNHVVNDGPLKKTTVILQSTLLHVKQNDNVNKIILSMGLKSI